MSNDLATLREALEYGRRKGFHNQNDIELVKFNEAIGILDRLEAQESREAEPYGYMVRDRHSLNDDDRQFIKSKSTADIYAKFGEPLPLYTIQADGGRRMSKKYKLRLPTITEAIEFRREAFGFNQTEMADALKVSRNRYSEYKKGTRGWPLRVLREAYRLGVPADCLFQVEQAP